MDSVASDHMCSQQSQFCNYRQRYPPRNVQLGDGSIIPATATREVSIAIRGPNAISGHGHHHMTLQKVLYVPELACILISISNMDREGCRTVMENQTCSVTSKNKLLMQAPLVDGMYRVDSTLTPMVLHTRRQHHALPRNA